MALPNKTQISNAVEHPTSFLAQQLKGYQPEAGILGPDHYSGGFCIVFPINNGKKRKALRVWHTEIENIKERYKYLSIDIARAKYSFLSNVEYIEGGLLVDGTQVDVVLMDWIEGLPLKKYIESVVYENSSKIIKKTQLLQLADKLLHLFNQMHAVHFAHGDLQHENIIVQASGDVKLIDYDNFYTPGLRGNFRQTTTGYSGYQHPIRSHLSNPISSEKDDIFAELVIYLSIKAIAEDLTLWNVARDDDFALLLTSEDFNDIQRSSTFSKVKQLGGEISLLCYILEEYLKVHSLSALEYFDVILDRMTQNPEINSFDISTKECLKGDDILISWNVKHYTQIRLNDKDVTGCTNVKESADSQNEYRLEVINYQKHISKAIKIKILPRPIISCKPSKTKLHAGKDEKVTLMWDVQNADSCSLIMPNGKSETYGNKDSVVVSPSETSRYTLRTLALDKKTIVDTPITIDVFPDAEVVFATDKEYVFPSIPFTLSWQVKNAKRVTLNGKIVKATDNITYEDGIEKNTIYTLSVTDEFGTKNHPLTIKMLPVPQIKAILVPTPHVNENINVSTKVPTPIINMNFPQPKIKDIELLDVGKYDVHVETNAIGIPKLITPNFNIEEPSMWKRAYNKLNKIFNRNGK